MGLALSHSGLDGRLTGIAYGEPQVLGVDQVIFWGSMKWGNSEACGVYTWLAAEPSFAKGHVVIVVFRCGVRIIVGRRRGVSLYHWCERSARWWWRKGRDVLF
jgi:hypothetical protein